ncbi:MAG: zinc-ribbon domain-containing protein [Blastocatellia bacterium]
MYCPKCGSNNLDDIKFCTRCGTNLNVVSEALSGKPSNQNPSDERMTNALKDYYASRRAVMIGGLLIPVGAAILAVMSTLGLPETLAVVALIALGIGLTVYGASVGIWGIRHWIDSTSEMKVLRLSDSSPALTPTSKDLSSAPPVVLAQQYATDPIEAGSITERTTRELEQSRRHLENQSKADSH